MPIRRSAAATPHRAEPGRPPDPGHDLRLVRRPGRARAGRHRRGGRVPGQPRHRDRDRPLRRARSPDPTRSRRRSHDLGYSVPTPGAGPRARPHGDEPPGRGDGPAPPDRGRGRSPSRCVLISMVPALMIDGWQWIAFVLATPVIFWAGWPFHRATLVNLRHGAVTMDTLVSLGTDRGLALVGGRAGLPRRRRRPAWRR